MLKKGYSLLLIFILCLFLSCQGKKESKADTPAKTESTEITLMLPDWGIPTDEILNEFKAETGITVKTLPTSWDDIKSKVSIAAAGKKAAADIIEVDWSWTGEFVSAGWLEPLEVDEATKNDILSVKYFTVDNKIYAMPYYNDLRVAYINQKMAKEAGVEVIDSYPDTWDKMLTAFGKLKDSKVIEYPMLFPLDAEEKLTTSFITLAYTRNGILFNNDDTLNRESVLDALTLLKQLLDKGYIDPASTSTPGGDTFRGIIKGNGAFLIGPTSYITSSNDEKESSVVGQIITIPIPGKTGASTKTVAFTEAMGISAYSENKEAAKKFIEWISRPENQLKLNKAIAMTPTRTSVIDKMTNDGELPGGPGSLVEQAKIVDTPFPNGVPKYYTKMSTEIFNIINQMALGKLTPEQATNTMVEKVDAMAKGN